MNILLVFAFMLFSIGTIHSETIEGTVTKVIDGDTIIIKNEFDQYWIKLAGIDAPDKGQRTFDESRRYLSVLLKMSDGMSLEDVRIDYESDDKYGRKLANVFSGDVLLNEVMVSSGYAWYLEDSASDKKLKKIEAEAKTKKRGIWAFLKTPVPPWEYRNLRKVEE